MRDSFEQLVLGRAWAECAVKPSVYDIGSGVDCDGVFLRRLGIMNIGG